MSVSQVKKRFAEFESFLKKDSDGLRRLKLLKDDVNELRIELAASIDAMNTAETIKNAARARADAAELSNAALRLEAESLRLQVHNLNQTVASLQKAEEPEDDDDQDVIDESSTSQEKLVHADIKATIKALRKRMPFCPRFVSHSKFENGNITVFDIESFIDKWSHANLWTLGAAMAILATLEGQVCLRSKRRMHFRKIEGIDDDHEGSMRHVVQWFFKHNVNTQSELFSVTPHDLSLALTRGSDNRVSKNSSPSDVLFPT